MVAYKSSKNGAQEPFLGYKLFMMLSNQLVLSDDFTGERSKWPGKHVTATALMNTLHGSFTSFYSL
jgi:hypothetical protein